MRSHEPFPDPEAMRADDVRPVGLDELIGGSDYLTIQAPLTPDTRYLFAADEAARVLTGQISLRGQAFSLLRSSV
ncbi:hypothetical protein Asi02nite_77960 [Asanoa siamensis]|uniref:D-isomer specific 2-hydroxyacid dehydrogenase NAD-binding domain-containing protein n=1 Tax=Asanoa siamensis TaxID=926357 RepID=A0ABQ4D4V1_9ACTN|nr:hypothetical protein Asi02nite_77960 [Asanoa siamensis]